MSLRPAHAFLFVLALIVGVQPCFAQTVSQKGMGMVTYGWRLSAVQRQEAMKKAEVNALERYIANTDSARSQMFESRQAEFASHIGDYVLDATVLSEQRDKGAKTYTVVVRATINTTRLLNDLGAGAASANKIASQSHEMLTFLFVARSQSSVQKFDSRVYKRADVDVSASRHTDEGEAIRRHDVQTSGGIKEHASVRTVSGGSTLNKADKVQWTVAQAGEINTAMTGTFANAGYDVIDAGQVEGASNGLLDIAKIRAAYSTGNDLPSKLMYQTTQGVHAAGIKLLAIGTLDVGLPDKDPVSGNTRVFVTVTGKVYDVSGRFARTLVSIGPVQYAGLGPNSTVAKTNALTIASRKASQHMVDELANRGIH
ncbi:hypothetical protein BTJ49_03690 [Oleiagrimonas sp. MCCC 1A03011]|nr:hypothetical protein BTJ49_03690 [Oleiagrimonas sp. MCCC 1A03011]